LCCAVCGLAAGRALSERRPQPTLGSHRLDASHGALQAASCARGCTVFHLYAALRHATASDREERFQSEMTDSLEPLGLAYVLVGSSPLITGTPAGISH
jgi:hypothetical protein